MKKLIISHIVLIFVTTCLFGQKAKVKNDPTHDDKLIHFGFSLGLNVMDYRIEHNEIAVMNGVYIGLKEAAPGINIHAIANLRLAENFDLRALPGISFGERFMYFEQPSASQPFYPAGKNYKVESSYLELPLLVKYKSKRLNNFRPYLIGGGNMRYDLAVKKEYDLEDQLIMINPFDIYGEIGFGMDFYLTFFKFATEIKYSFGLSNILRGSDRNGELPPEFEKYTTYINSIKSHMVVVSFHFE
ncbi:MAG: porin family protein [Bacteroidales bacterium]